ncbi:MAG TPA: molybdopterin-dependent oxidoreductase [Acidimicrobiales bacterium]|nr:molybdopterin-dependent oxidoreductase [Acidimicrobiales bacterium]
MTRSAGERHPRGGTPVGRRVLLGMGALGAVGVVVGSTVQRVVGDVLRPVANTGGGGLGALIPGADRFRIYTIVDFNPEPARGGYRLAVDGLVDRPLSLSLADLAAMPRTNLVKDFQCVTGWRVPSVHWSGVSLAHIIDAAGASPRARAVLFDSFDGAYTESLTMEQARRPDVIVADRMLGVPVTQEHGGPVRLYVAPMYGYKSIKWLGRIRLSDQVVPGYWEQQGYDVDGWVGRSNGRSDAPIDA